MARPRDTGLIFYCIIKSKLVGDAKSARRLEIRMGRHLIKFEVEGLFNAFDHQVPLNQTEGATIITAPNGYGKTAVLRLINAFFAQDIITLSNIIYARLIFDFDDGMSIYVSQIRDGDTTTALEFIQEASSIQTSTFKLEIGRIEPSSFPTQIIDDLLPQLEHVAPRRWFDQQTGKNMGLDDVWKSYGHILIREANVLGYPGIALGVSGKDAIPEWLSLASSSIDCRFIETQRLLDFSQRRNNRRDPRRPPRSVTVVEMQALDLREAIQEKLAEFTNKSQERDRTFPHRVIERSSELPISEETLQDHITKLEDKRSKLVDVGILDSSEGYIPIAMNKADTSTRNVLQVYVEDSVLKLDVFDSLYKRVSVFLDIINEKFGSQRADGAKKRVRCNKDRGLVVDIGENRTVELGQLSSGEQHEIVLFYDIVFRMKSNTLLLIDEPELSLHIGWQKKFVPDLLEIIAANEMRVLLATHSPQIINNRRDLRVSLGVNKDA